MEGRAAYNSFSGQAAKWRQLRDGLGYNSGVFRRKCVSGQLKQNVQFVGSLVASRLLGRPLLLSHLVTGRCPCLCETCLWRGMSDPRDELSAAEIAEVYRDAARCGVRVNSIWGGEPLVREDLPEILQASREAGLLTILISSGLRFSQRYNEIVPRLAVAIFSLDDLGARHDAMRGRPGLFDEVCRVIRRMRRENPNKRIYINTVISRLNAEALDGLAGLARALRVPIYFNPMETGTLGGTQTVTPKQDLALDDTARSDAVRRLIVLKGRGYPIANSYTYLRGFIGGKQKYRCHARKLCLQLRPDGDLVDCLDRSRPVANVRTTRLTELLSRPDVRRRRLENVACHFCNNANVIDTSHLWELRPESVYSLVRRHVSGR